MTMWIRKDSSHKACEECKREICDNEEALRLSLAGYIFYLCPTCAGELHGDMGKELGHLTINGLVDMAYETASANGFHDQDHLPVTPESAYGQIAGMALSAICWADVVEAIRKPQDQKVDRRIQFLLDEVKELRSNGPEAVAKRMMTTLQLEPWQMRLLCWLGLMVTELAEAMEAVIKRDKANFQEELADTGIRKGDTVGAINDDTNHPFNGLDLEAAILAKNERNKARGYRHGGKKA